MACMIPFLCSLKEYESERREKQIANKNGMGALYPPASASHLSIATTCGSQKRAANTAPLLQGVPRSSTFIIV